MEEKKESRNYEEFVRKERYLYKEDAVVLLAGPDKEKTFQLASEAVHCHETLIKEIDSYIGIDFRRLIYKLYHRASGDLDLLKADCLTKFRHDYAKELPDNEIWDKVVDYYKREIWDRIDVYRPYDAERIYKFDRMERASSAGGQYIFNGNSMTNLDVAPEMTRIYNVWRQNPPKISSPIEFADEWFNDCAAFMRRQISKAKVNDCNIIIQGAKNKVRMIFGTGPFVKLHECRFLYPILDQIDKIVEKENNFSFFMQNWEISNGGMMRFNTAMREMKFIQTSDFELHDGSISPVGIKYMFGSIRSKIDFKRSGLSIDQLIFDALEYFYINTRIRFSDGQQIQTTGGSSSGSVFTPFVSTMITGYACTYVWLKLTGEFPDFIKIQIDDNILASFKRQTFTLEMWQYEMRKAFNMNVRLNKSEQLIDGNKNFEILGFRNKNGFPSKESIEWFARVLMPEGYDKTFEDGYNRVFGLYYASSGQAPMFDTFAYKFLTKYLFSLKSREFKPKKDWMKWLKHVVGFQLPTTINNIKTETQLRNILYCTTMRYIFDDTKN